MGLLDTALNYIGFGSTPAEAFESCEIDTTEPKGDPNLSICLDDYSTDKVECNTIPCKIKTDLNGNGKLDTLTLDFSDEYTKSDDSDAECRYTFTTVLDGNGVRVRTDTSMDMDNQDWYNGRSSFQSLDCKKRFVSGAYDPETQRFKLAYRNDDLFAEPQRTVTETLFYEAASFFTQVNGVRLDQIDWVTYTTLGTETLKSLTEATQFEIFTFADLLHAANPGLKLPVRAVSGAYDYEYFDKNWPQGQTFKLPVMNENYTGRKDDRAPDYCRTSNWGFPRKKTTCFYPDDAYATSDVSGV